MKIIRTLKRDGFSLTAYRSLVEIKQLALKTLSLARHSKFIKTYYGVMMRANWGDITFEACVKGHYGRFLSDYLIAIDNGFIFLDIGANQGLYSLIAATNPHCNRVLSFEPVKSTFGLLKENIDNTDDKHIITPLNFALSSEDGSAQIGKKIDQSGLASLHNTFDQPVLETILLRKPESISDYIRADERIVIKIDTEGHEQTILDQLIKSPFSTQIDSIFYEVDERWASPAALEASARNMGLTKIMKVGTGTHYDVLASR